jgi:hypothetical protein
MDRSYDYHNMGRRIVRAYDALTSDAHRALIDHFFGETVEEIRAKIGRLS